MEYQTIPPDAESEVLSSEEFMRIYEVAPRLVLDLASRAGNSVASLRKMASEGKLSSAVLLGQPG